MSAMLQAALQKGRRRFLVRREKQEDNTDAAAESFKTYDGYIQVPEWKGNRRGQWFKNCACLA